jgi:hypothetical protein
MKIPCQHFTRERDRGQGKCALGHFNGRPYVGNCRECLAAGWHEGGLGDKIERLVKPIARALGLPCLDAQGHLRPESGCAKRRALLNRLTPRRRTPPTP